VATDASSVPENIPGAAVDENRFNINNFKQYPAGMVLAAGFSREFPVIFLQQKRGQPES
jgi:hypothetical protein